MFFDKLKNKQDRLTDACNISFQLIWFRILHFPKNREQFSNLTLLILGEIIFKGHFGIKLVYFKFFWQLKDISKYSFRHPFHI